MSVFVVAFHDLDLSENTELISWEKKKREYIITFSLELLDLKIINTSQLSASRYLSIKTSDIIP